VYNDGTDEDEPSDEDEQTNPDDDPKYEDSDDESDGEQNEDEENDLNETDNNKEIDTDQLEVDATQGDEQQLETNEYGRKLLEDVPNEDSEQRSADTTENNNVESNNVESNNVEQNPEPRSDGRPRRSSKATTRQTYAPKFEGKSYRAQFLSISNRKEKQWPSECYKIAVDVMFTQMSAGKGIKQFGERAVAAMFKEYNQLNDLTVFGRVNPDTPTQEQKNNALRAINLIKEK